MKTHFSGWENIWKTLFPSQSTRYTENIRTIYPYSSRTKKGKRNANIFNDIISPTDTLEFARMLQNRSHIMDWSWKKSKSSIQCLSPSQRSSALFEAEILALSLILKVITMQIFDFEIHSKISKWKKKFFLLLASIRTLLFISRVSSIFYLKGFLESNLFRLTLLMEK